MILICYYENYILYCIHVYRYSCCYLVLIRLARFQILEQYLAYNIESPTLQEFIYYAPMKYSKKDKSV